MSLNSNDKQQEFLSVSFPEEQNHLEQLLEQQRGRLRKMVTARLDPRLAARIDPSDVVQETMLEAMLKLPEYLREKPLPLYPWLRQLAAHKMSRLAEHHITAKRRSVTREQRYGLGVSDESLQLLVDRLVAPNSSPSQHAIQQERQREIRAALDELPEMDREVLLLQFIEQMSASETAQVMNLTPEAVGMRRLRALRRLSRALGGR